MNSLAGQDRTGQDSPRGSEVWKRMLQRSPRVWRFVFGHLPLSSRRMSTELGSGAAAGPFLIGPTGPARGRGREGKRREGKRREGKGREEMGVHLVSQSAPSSTQLFTARFAATATTNDDSIFPCVDAMHGGKVQVPFQVHGRQNGRSPRKSRGLRCVCTTFTFLRGLARVKLDQVSALLNFG